LGRRTVNGITLATRGRSKKKKKKEFGAILTIMERIGAKGLIERRKSQKLKGRPRGKKCPLLTSDKYRRRTTEMERRTAKHHDSENRRESGIG